MNQEMERIIEYLELKHKTNNKDYLPFIIQKDIQKILNKGDPKAFNNLISLYSLTIKNQRRDLNCCICNVLKHFSHSSRIEFKFYPDNAVDLHILVSNLADNAYNRLNKKGQGVILKLYRKHGDYDSKEIKYIKQLKEIVSLNDFTLTEKYLDEEKDLLNGNDPVFYENLEIVYPTGNKGKYNYKYLKVRPSFGFYITVKDIHKNLISIREKLPEDVIPYSLKKYKKDDKNYLEILF